MGKRFLILFLFIALNCFGGSTVNLSWPAIPNAQKYELWATSDLNVPFQIVATLQNNSISFPALEAQGYYHVKCFYTDYAAKTSVNLAWDYDCYAYEITGFYVYSGQISDIYNTRTFVPNCANTTFTVNNLAPNLSYFFTVTSVDSSGIESVNSNEISLVNTPQPVTNVVSVNCSISLDAR